MIDSKAAMGLMIQCRMHKNEICGYILQDWTTIPLQNIADSDEEFEMDHDQTRYMYNNHYLQIMGVYHSHPTGVAEPSNIDIRHAPRGMRYFIVTDDVVVEWEIADGKPKSARLVDKVSYAPEKAGQAAVR